MIPGFPRAVIWSGSLPGREVRRPRISPHTSERPNPVPSAIRLFRVNRRSFTTYDSENPSIGPIKGARSMLATTATPLFWMIPSPATRADMATNQR